SVWSEDQRKDTAAYASLSVFTCQRAKPVRNGQEREPRSSHLALAPGSRGLQSGTTIPWPPSMERCLAKLVPDVNNNFEVFCRFEFRSHQPSVFGAGFIARKDEIISTFTLSQAVFTT
ncbi:hypothetical protein, partial [Microvirga sp. KLBC 81]|uniref:hypothetical protein n=1 Tax=Microvirga sp. KLBC 81 TaxID=1862707 RepID=UPI00197B7FE2